MKYNKEKTTVLYIKAHSPLQTFTILPHPVSSQLRHQQNKKREE